MEVNFKKIKNPDCLEFEFVGLYPTDDSSIENIYNMVAEKSTYHKNRKIILDYREMIYRQEPHQILNASDRLHKYDLNAPDYYCAIVCKPDSETHRNYRLFLAEIDTKRFLGTLKSNYRLFHCHDEALEWLKNPE